MPTLEIIQDPLYTATVNDLLREMRDVIDYLLASKCELLKDFASGQHTDLLEALEVLRLTRAVVSLEKALESGQRCGLPAARPGGDGIHVIDIHEHGQERRAIDNLKFHEGRGHEKAGADANVWSQVQAGRPFWAGVLARQPAGSPKEEGRLEGGLVSSS